MSSEPCGPETCGAVCDCSDRLEEACAVFGVFTVDGDAARQAYFGLHALQHRGQESAGIAVGNGRSVLVYKDQGLVSRVFSEATLAPMEGKVAIGHTRYSTSGGSASWNDAQPHLSNIDVSIIALAHNGTLVNSNALRNQLIGMGYSFRSASDSEVAAKFIAYFTRQSNHMREGIRRTMELLEGAYAMVIITADALYAFRDPNGIRPLCLGELPDDRGWVVASETCGLDIVGARFVRDIAPGEILRINAQGLASEQALQPQRRAFCIFEYVYFARPDSILDGISVYMARSAMGRRLAVEADVSADLVLGVPDSGIPGAIGYAHASGIPYAEGIVKNRYVGRTFIQPTQALRQRGIRLKLNPLSAVISGQRLVLVDDSIVRGNTSRQMVSMLRDAGAAEVHFRVLSPAIVWPCFYGIDTDSQQQLIAASKDLEGIRDFIGADSLAYLSEEGLLSCCTTGDPGSAGGEQGNGIVSDGSGCGMIDRHLPSVGSEHHGFCTACFSGDYPVMPREQLAAGVFCGSLEPRFDGSDELSTERLFSLED
ncbi:MAG: amidophosphoribosyltransferase [Actinomycetia bacterium]|nr:amidophosphoribosyltransferase [Actinomycetes bacterium]